MTSVLECGASTSFFQLFDGKLLGFGPRTQSVREVEVFLFLYVQDAGATP